MAISYATSYRIPDSDPPCNRYLYIYICVYIYIYIPRVATTWPNYRSQTGIELDIGTHVVIGIPV